MMMIMRSTLILGKTCLTESAPLLRWLGIDQTFHCYSLFSNHSAVTQDTVLLRCFLQIFSMCFCWFVHHSEYCLVRTRSSLQTSSCFLLVVLAISSYFLYKGRQQRKSESLAAEFVLLLHSSTPETRNPTIIEKIMSTFIITFDVFLVHIKMNIDICYHLL